MIRSTFVSVAILCSSLAITTPSVGLSGADSPAVDVYQLPFDFRDEHGSPIRLQRWRGQTLLLTMAYSACRETCIYTLRRTEELQRSAERAGRQVQVVVISYDPNVDSPATWLSYRRHHHFTREDWHFLTGDAESTASFARQLKFPYWVYDEHVVHDFQILLVGADGLVADSANWASRSADFFAAASKGCHPTDPGSC